MMLVEAAREEAKRESQLQAQQSRSQQQLPRRQLQLQNNQKQSKQLRATKQVQQPKNHHHHLRVEAHLQSCRLLFLQSSNHNSRIIPVPLGQHRAMIHHRTHQMSPTGPTDTRKERKRKTSKTIRSSNCQRKRSHLPNNNNYPVTSLLQHTSKADNNAADAPLPQDS